VNASETAVIVSKMYPPSIAARYQRPFTYRKSTGVNAAVSNCRDVDARVHSHGRTDVANDWPAVRNRSKESRRCDGMGAVVTTRKYEIAETAALSIGLDNGELFAFKCLRTSGTKKPTRLRILRASGWRTGTVSTVCVVFVSHHRIRLPPRSR